jgi:lysophospholipase L1-like esterase
VRFINRRQFAISGALAAVLSIVLPITFSTQTDASLNPEIEIEAMAPITPAYQLPDDNSSALGQFGSELPQQAVTSRAGTRDLAVPGSTELRNQSVTGEQVTAIGDSLMVGATPLLEQLLPGISIDGEVGRALSAGSAVLSAAISNGTCGSYVVLGLATNGLVSVDEYELVFRMLPEGTKLILVNAYGDRVWIPSTNDALATFAAANPERVFVADWQALVHANPGYIGGDGIHPTTVGREAYADLVVQTLNAAAGH